MAASEEQAFPSRANSGSEDGIPASARRRAGSPAQVFAACIAGASVLAILSPPDSPSWTERDGDHPGIAAVREAAGEWADFDAQLGLTLPHQALRRIVRQLMEVQWR